MEDAVRMGPVVRLRLEHGYGRELPPRHAEMLQGNGERPDWAREFGTADRTYQKFVRCLTDASASPVIRG